MAFNGNGLTCDERLAEPVAIVTAVAEQYRGLGHSLEQESRVLVVAHLAFGEQHDAGPATVVTDRVELGVQAAFGSADTSGNSPFLSRLAAVRWALRWVASIIS